MRLETGNEWISRIPGVDFEFRILYLPRQPLAGVLVISYKMDTGHFWPEGGKGCRALGISSLVSGGRVATASPSGPPRFQLKEEPTMIRLSHCLGLALALAVLLSLATSAKAAEE